jgi:diguanylate cyclase (GGDEF)-like protein/PAS domain S-box-containing protein
MGKPLKVVVVGDTHAAALKVGLDLEECGYEPAIFLAPGEADLERLAPSCDIVLALGDATGLPPGRALELAAEHGGFPSVIVYAAGFTEDDVVALMRAGASNCVRQGDQGRLTAAVERDRSQAGSRGAEGRQRAEAGDRYRALIEEIPALTYVAWADEVGSRAYVSPQLLAMTGFSAGEWLAERDMWVRRLHPEDRERVLRQFRHACATGERFTSEYRILDRDGRVVWWRDEGKVLPDPDGKARFVRGFVLDVTEQRLAEESLRRMRFFDQLTGLPNRALLQNRLGRALSESVAADRPLALLILALDNFRDVTNTLGHHNGDVIVRELAARLGDALGDRDRVSRLRGDEFGVLLPDADAAFAEKTGERILRSLERPFMVLKLPIEVSASVGIAVAPEHGTEAEVLLRRADAAVQRARKLGGGQSLLYSPECEPHPTRLALLGELRQALEGNELQLYYQPKVDLKTRAVVGAEALLRWPHPKRGFVSPGEFIPLAEETGAGLIRPLTRWVLDHAAGEARGWERAGRRIPVAVNISARSLRDGRIVEDIEEALLAYGLGSNGLQVEVTESAIKGDPDRAAEVLKSLASRGVAVSIDDFGVDYSSLGRLRRLPVRELKIDRQFVSEMADEDKSTDDTVFVGSAVALAHNLGLNAVAEGVENQWTLDWLSDNGCDQAQGFHIARPMPGPAFSKWLGNSPWRVLES